MKTYHFPFAVTLESSLSAADFALLQKYDPRSLALHEMDLSVNMEKEIFRISHCVTSNTGSVDANAVMFVGETGKEHGMAGNPGVTILIPATLKGDAIKAYIRDKVAAIEANVNIVETNAKKAIEVVKANNKRFEDNIITLSPKSVKEAAPKAEDKAPVADKKEGGSKK